jgi:hypothetical protein
VFNPKTDNVAVKQRLIYCCRGEYYVCMQFVMTTRVQNIPSLGRAL